MGRIVEKNMKKKCHKQAKGQYFSLAAKTKRKNRATELLRRFRRRVHKTILFTNKKLFTVEQFLNKQNDRIYSSLKPNMTIQRTGYPKTVMVFASITTDGKTPLIFVPQEIKVNGSNYLSEEPTYALDKKTLSKQAVLLSTERSFSSQASFRLSMVRTELPGLHRL